MTYYFDKRTKDKHYWLTPPDVYAALDQEFHFDFDPCPYPRPEGYDSLILPWGMMNYCNPPYRKEDGSPTQFIRKAIAEQDEGRSTLMCVPSMSHINILIRAGAEFGATEKRIKFLETETGEPAPLPNYTLFAFLRGK